MAELEFDPNNYVSVLRYRPGTYPDTNAGDLYQIAYAFAWGWAHSRKLRLSSADVAQWAERWSRTSYHEREPLTVAFDAAEYGMRRGFD